MKRFLPLFLALLMICFSFAACNKSKEENTTPSDEATQPSADTETPYELPTKDLGEREMTILMSTAAIRQFTEDTSNADVLNKGLMQRNEFVESKLNCALYFNNVPLNAELMSSIMTAEMLNQTGDYDIIFYEYWWNQEIHGYFYNLLESDVIAIDQPFYCNGWNDAATIMGTLNSLTGYGSIDMMTRTAVTVFNKNMYNSLFEDSVYDYVDSGDWTLETMEIMAKAAHIDSGNDGIIENPGERYGMVYDLWGGRAMLFTMGGIVTQKTDDGIPQINYISEHNLDILEQMQRLYNENYVYFNRNDAVTSFVNSQALFSLTTFERVQEIRMADSGVQYGLVPYPKLDLNQTDYISTNTGCGTWSIPVTAESREDSSYLLNAFHYASNQYVRPAYFDTVLKTQVAGDPESSRMIDLIMDTIYMDFAFIHDVNLSMGIKNSKGQDLAVCNGTFEIIRGNVTQDFVSFYTSIKDALDANLEEFVQRYVYGSGSAV